MQEKVVQFIEEIRPLIQGHGGDVEFVSMEGHTVNLRLHGACHACPHAMMTLKNGWPAGRIANRVKKEKWLHGDFRDVAFFFVHPLYNDICTRGGLR